MTSLHSCSPRCWFIVVSVQRGYLLPPRWLRVVIYIYIYTYIYFHSRDVSIRRDAVTRGRISSANWTNFYFVLSPLFITDGSNSRDGRSKVFAARSAVAAKYWAKSLTKNRWGWRIGLAIKFAKRILSTGEGNHSDGDVIDLKPTLWTGA